MVKQTSGAKSARASASHYRRLTPAMRISAILILGGFPVAEALSALAGGVLAALLAPATAWAAECGGDIQIHLLLPPQAPIDENPVHAGVPETRYIRVYQEPVHTGVPRRVIAKSAKSRLPPN
jgi:hypothetical protein